MAGSYTKGDLEPAVKNVLITGGAGFIGSHLAADLIARGYRVTLLDNLSAQIHGENAPPPQLAGTSTFIRGDVRSREDWLRALRDQDVVVHLAAETGTGQSMYAVERYMDVNVRGTALLLDLLANQSHRVGRIVIASSRAVYGEGKYRCPQHGVVYPESRKAADMQRGDFSIKCPQCALELALVPTDEDSRLHPESIYGISKHAQEQMVLVTGRALGIPVVALRYQNVYGPGQSLRNPYTGILSIFSTRIRHGAPISIFEDGTESRDFVYIDDVVNATRLAIESDAAAHGVFNVGSGVATSVLAVAHGLREGLGGDSTVEVDGRFRLGDIRHNLADITRIRHALGFEPRTGFAQGLDRFIAWVRTQELPVDQFARSIEELERRGLYK